MKQQPKTCRPMLVSIISMVACIAVLIGATFAWFTETQSNKTNRIEAGTLDITAQWYDVQSTDATYTITETGMPSGIAARSYTYTFADAGTDFASTTSGAMIEESNWRSGSVNAKLIEITNHGSLDATIALNAVAVDGGLQDALWFDFIPVTEGTTTFTFTAQPIATLASVVSATPVELLAATDGTESKLQFILVYGMLDSAGNTYQNTEYTADITITATQQGEENNVVYASSIDDITALNTATDATDKTVILLCDIISDEDVTLTTNVNFDLNGYTLQVGSFSMVTDIYCTVDIANGIIKATKGDFVIDVPAGTVTFTNLVGAVKDGVGEVVFDASYSTLNLVGTIGFVQLDENNELTDTLVDVIVQEETRVVVATTSSIVLVPQNDVIIEDNRSDVDEDAVLVTNGTITVMVNEGVTGVEIFNTDATASNIVTEGDGLKDTTVDGESQATADVDGVKYGSLADAVAAVGEGSTLTLLKDVTLSEPFTITTSTAFTFDGGNHTISYTYGATSNLTDYAALRLGASTNITLQNLTISTDHMALATCGTTVIDQLTVVGDGYYGIACYGAAQVYIKYADVTVTGMALTSSDATSYATLSCIVDDGVYTTTEDYWNKCPIYWTGAGSLTINGGTFTGSTDSSNGAAGLYAKNGIITVNGGTFTAKDGLKLEYSSSETDKMEVTINDGVFTGVSRSGIYLSSWTSTSPTSLAITGGTFIGENASYLAFKGTANDYENVSISGGSFNEDVPATYLAAGYTATVSGDYWVVSKSE